jgi:hypothetical protein
VRLALRLGAAGAFVLAIVGAGFTVLTLVAVLALLARLERRS